MNLEKSIGSFLTEMWLSEDISNSKVEIHDYSPFRSDRLGPVEVELKPISVLNLAVTTPME